MNHDVLLSRIKDKQEFTYRGAFPSLRLIALEAKVPPSTFTRLAAGKGLTADALLRIMEWLVAKGETWGELAPALVSRKRKNGRKP